MTSGIAADEATAILRAKRSSVDTGLHHRDAVRLLFILALGSEADETVGDAGPVRIFRGEKRAMAIDFLVRYPDYLAHELLNRYEHERRPEQLAEVETIFAADEPDVRLVKMIRWHRGAFQNIETPLAILRFHGLVRALRKSGGQRRHDFVVEPAAFAFMDDAILRQPALAWYRDRAALVMSLAGFRSGSSLKDDQYLHEEYRDAPLGTEIPSIRDRVLDRLKRLRGTP